MNRTIATTLALVSAATASATTHVVTQSGFTFSPSTVNVVPGDTIQWVRTAGSHTVTSGTPCQANGLFSGVLNASNPTFVWVVPKSAAGTTIGYFCIPHCSFGMTGTIIVGEPLDPADLNGDGLVGPADLAILLAAWGGTGPADLDGNGSVGAEDLAILLGAWNA